MSVPHPGQDDDASEKDSRNDERDTDNDNNESKNTEKEADDNSKSNEVENDSDGTGKGNNNKDEEEDVSDKSVDDVDADAARQLPEDRHKATVHHVKERYKATKSSKARFTQVKFFNGYPSNYILEISF